MSFKRVDKDWKDYWQKEKCKVFVIQFKEKKNRIEIKSGVQELAVDIKIPATGFQMRRRELRESQ